MTKRMLIDASHAEETRVVVLDGNRLEDFDVETASRRQLKGNIYLAKVVRVEPSLQAAFVEYGGNRHGFLAFGEIHPDYYQIPVADRQRLLAMQEEEARAEEEAEDEDAPVFQASEPALEAPAPETAGETAPHEEGPNEPAPGVDLAPEAAEPAPDSEDAGSNLRQVEGEAPAPEASGSETEDPRPARSASRFMRSYKIQEVIRRRQILLIQVVKEERGTKGAALTTYISLAGRYCVLMPNSPRGGGISRKITSAADRRRLKEVTTELDIPRGMGLIVRTAGAMRPKPEIKRDGEYLLRLWDDIREKTMASMAPALIHEEATLIKRVIRDVYARDVDELLIDGEDGWRAAREFMRMIMPTHVKKVQLWPQGGQPLFAHQQVESMLDAMLNPTVQLRSGGYLVINQTEALVAIDVNSGRSTRERGIEETALRTNLEAAEETARQLRLRDLAGLVVIDFIDMESKKHNAMVERRMAESLKNDRARIQIGHISHFGLMELSRQRLRPSLAETSLTICENCSGTGHVRSTESAALHVLREIEEEGGKLRAAEILVHVAPATALYILNNKRARLSEIEARYRMIICFAADEALQASETRIDKIRAQAAQDVPVLAAPVLQPIVDEAEVALPDEEDEQEAAPSQTRDPARDQARDQAGDPDAKPGETAEEGEQRRRRRRRRRRGGRRDEQATDATPLPVNAEQPDIAHPQAAFPTMEREPEPNYAAAELGAEGASLPDAVAQATIETTSSATPEPAPEPAPAPAPQVSFIQAPGHDEANEALVEAAAEAAAETRAEAAVEEEAGANTGAAPAKRSRRGGRRRRKPGETAADPETAGTPNAIYVGPTPADPFASSAADIFDLLEPLETLAPPPEAAPPPAPPAKPRRAPRGAKAAAARLAAEASDPALADSAGTELTIAATSDPAPALTAPSPASPIDPEPSIPPLAAAPAAELPKSAKPAQAKPEPAKPEPAQSEPIVVANGQAEALDPSIVRPVLIGPGEAVAEKKRGWWRR